MGSVAESTTLDAEEFAPAVDPDDGIPRRSWRREVVVVLAFYYAYEGVRRLAASTDAIRGGIVRPNTRAYRNATLLVRLEKFTQIYHEQAIQQFFLGATWFIRAMNIYYGTLHFFVTAGLLVWVFRYRHAAYRRMRNLLGLTTALALFGYWLFPLAPPRLYPCDCFVDTLDTVGGLWSYHSPVAKAVANNYAAMPSLHFGWAVWCGIVIWTLMRGRLSRIAAYAYPVLTLTAIVVTANHFFLDAVGGVLTLLAAVGLLNLANRIRARRRSAAAITEEIGSVPAG
jgi:hypothetical protein